jgi:hypothetical protein
MDAGAMGIALAYELCGGFYTFHVAKFGKPLKKEAIAATNVQNVPSSFGRRKRTQRFHDEFCPGTPPPVLQVKLAVNFAVGSVHEGFSPVK